MLVGCSNWVAASAAESGGTLSLRSLLGPRRRGRDAKGDSFRECMASNESS